MRALLIAIAVATLAIFTNNPAVAQGILASQLKNLYVSWEKSLEAGEGQKVRREAESALNSSGQQVSPVNYNEMHAKVALLGYAAKGAVLEGDWPRAASLLAQASSTAQLNYATASETLGSLLKQHETKISEWRELIRPHEEQLDRLKTLPGLRSDQIKQYGELETFINEHQNAIAASGQAIKDIGDILLLLRTEDETCSRSLNEWNGLLTQERAEIQGFGSSQRYVTEKLAQVIGQSGDKSRFERVSYARRLVTLDPTNEQARRHLNSLLGIKTPEPSKPPAKK